MFGSGVADACTSHTKDFTCSHLGKHPQLAPGVRQIARELVVAGIQHMQRSKTPTWQIWQGSPALTSSRVLAGAYAEFRTFSRDADDYGPSSAVHLSTHVALFEQGNGCSKQP